MSLLLDPFLTEGVAERLATVDWHQLADGLNTVGTGKISHLLLPEECTRLTALYQNEGLFRSRVVMARYNFGRGEYKYFDYPLPGLLAELRKLLYPHLATVANGWH